MILRDRRFEHNTSSARITCFSALYLDYMFIGLFLYRLEGKVAIVTRGIGEATVRLFVKNGAKVAIADIEDTSGTILANELYTSAIYVYCDVSLEDDIKNLINKPSPIMAD